MENRQDNPPKQSPNRLVQLLEAQPLMFWGGLWASLVLVAGVSVSSLVSPGLIGSGQTASGAAIGSSGNASSNVAVNTVAQPASPSTAAKTSFPFWLFSAIALSCTAGSILVSKQLAPQRSRRILRPPHARSVPAPSAQRPAVQPQRLRQRRSQPQPVAQPQFVPAQSQPPVTIPAPLVAKVQAKGQATRNAPSRNQAASGQAVKGQAVKGRSSTPSHRAMPPNATLAHSSSRRVASPPPVPARPVAIVPPSESHPLDWQTGSLADSLDLRKQRSLASWL
jgi:hypothetical protein